MFNKIAGLVSRMPDRRRIAVPFTKVFGQGIFVYGSSV